MRACVRAGIRACVRACRRASVPACMRACVYNVGAGIATVMFSCRSRVCVNEKPSRRSRQRVSLNPYVHNIHPKRGRLLFSV